jgi:hypothetical protein
LLLALPPLQLLPQREAVGDHVAPQLAVQVVQAAAGALVMALLAAQVHLVKEMMGGLPLLRRGLVLLVAAAVQVVLVALVQRQSLIQILEVVGRAFVLL